MARYIDADALIFKLETQDYSCAPDTLEDWTPEDMTRAEIADIEHAPTVYAVEVVRCKECSWCQLKRIHREKFEPLFECILWEKPTTSEFYCAAGERREDADN